MALQQSTRRQIPNLATISPPTPPQLGKTQKFSGSAVSGSGRTAPPLRLAVLLLAAAALLSACGGGGGGGGGGGNSAGSGTGSRCAGTALFGCLVANQWGLGRVRTEPAWRRISDSNGKVTAPGDGQTVGVVDSGIDRDHRAFCGSSAPCRKTVTEQFLGSATDETGTRISHGTAVASVIAGRLFNAVGVAWGADVAMFAIPLWTGGSTYRPVSLATRASDTYGPAPLATFATNDDFFETVYDRVLNWSSGTRTLDFVNLSFNYNGIVDQYSTQDLRSNYSDTIAALAQTGATEKTVFVRSAGNAHGKPCDPADFTGNADLCESYVENGLTKYRVNAKSVEILPGLPVLIPELRGHIVAVVAIGPDGSIASFSNRCGSAAQWCLAAPGVQIRAAYFGPYTDPVTNEVTTGWRGRYNPSGTSFAAPMVTGALVVMKHYFRDQMSNTALVERMLDTANDRGIYAGSTVYGHGLLDLDAATTPVGTSSLALGNTVGGPGSPLVQTRLTLGNALGNGLTRALAGQEVAAFDELGAPFWYKLGGFARAAPGPSGMARLNAFMAWPEGDRNAATAGIGRAPVGGFMPGNRGVGATGLRLGLLGGPSGGMGGGHLALAGRALALSMAGSAGERTEQRAGERTGERVGGPGGLGFTVFSTEGQRGQAPVSGAVLSWRSPERPVGLRAGLIGERESLLGSRAAGAFGRLSAGSAFVGFEDGTQIGAWRLDAGAEIGMAHAAAGGGLITGVSPLFSSAFAIRAQRPLAGGDSLHVSITQPLRLESGRARLSVPVGRTKDGRVLRRPLTADLAPTGRQIEIAAQWHRPLPAAGAVRLGATWTVHPGHDAAAPSDLTLLAGWRYKF